MLEKCRRSSYVNFVLPSYVCGFVKEASSPLLQTPKSGLATCNQSAHADARHVEWA